MMKPRLTSLVALLAWGLGCAASPPPLPASPVNVGSAPEPRCEDRVSPAQKLIDEADHLKGIDLDKAISLYIEASKLEPRSHLAAIKLGMAYRKREDWTKAGEAFARATEIRPEAADGWYQRGIAEAEAARKTRGSMIASKASFQRCVEVDPNFAECYARLGLVMLAEDDEQGAVEAFGKAILHAPGVMNHYAMLADLYLRLDLPKEAEVVLKEAVKRGAPEDKGLFTIHVLLAQVYQDRGAIPQMVSELEEARAVPGLDGPEAVLILFNLGSAYATLLPPRRVEALDLLKAFITRVCKGSKANLYKAECSTSAALVTQLGGVLP